MKRAILIALGLMLANGAYAGDWPQWLGPNRDGVSPEKVVPWKAAPTELWKKAAGEAHSSPIVADGKLYLHTKVEGKEAEALTAYDIKTGTIAWEVTYPREMFTTPFGNGPRATPSVVGENIYTLGITGLLTCFATKDGSQVWQVDTLKDFSAKNLTFGVSASPLVIDGMVIVQVGGKGAGIVAFDAKTGKVVWKATDDPASYAAPALRTIGGKPVVVVLTGRNLVGLNPADGKVIWQQPFRDLLNESSTTPIVVGNTIFASSVTAGSIGLKWDADEMKIEQVWKNPKLTCYFGTPIPFGKQDVLMVTGALLPPVSATLRCVDATTGKEEWNHPKVGKYHATLMGVADGQALMLEEGGELVLIGNRADRYTELARSKICGETWAHPALVDGILYLRDNKEVMALRLNR